MYMVLENLEWPMKREVCQSRAASATTTALAGRGLNLSAQPKFERVENADGSTTFQRTVIGKLGYGLPMRLFKDSGKATFSLSVSGGGGRETS